MNGKQHDGRDEGDAELLGDVHAALTSLGWIPPQSEADVARAEQELAAAELPDALADAKAVFERPVAPSRANIPCLPSAADPYIDATLARAAREGGPIAPEIEERMRRDRGAAEREFDRETENQ